MVLVILCIITAIIQTHNERAGGGKFPGGEGGNGKKTENEQKSPKNSSI